MTNWSLKFLSSSQTKGGVKFLNTVKEVYLACIFLKVYDV